MLRPFTESIILVDDVEGNMNRMKRIREEREVTQAEICIRTGLHPSTVSRIERGIIKGNLSHRRKIARALKVGPREIFPLA
jgi:transcriptional regulator with XRE-family HTH domain